MVLPNSRPYSKKTKVRIGCKKSVEQMKEGEPSALPLISFEPGIYIPSIAAPTSVSRPVKIKVAHSADPERGILWEQPYPHHSMISRERGLKAFDAMAPYLNLPRRVIATLREMLDNILEYHDLGKLEKLIQDIMYDGHKQKMINHVDAGVAYMLQKYRETENECYVIQAILLHAHHIGILSKPVNPDRPSGVDPQFVSLPEILIDPDCLRDGKVVVKKYEHYRKVLLSDKETVREYIDRILPSLLQEHRECVGEEIPRKFSYAKLVLKYICKCPMILRFMLSCIAEGDHWDTARHYGQIAPHAITLPLEPTHIISYFERKYRDLNTPKKEQTNGEIEKNRVRNLVKLDCDCSDLVSHLYGLYAYPGYGKTLAGLKLALLLCEKYGLRGIMYAAPFNNILSQNLQEMRNFLVREGIDSTTVIGEHHQDAIHFERALEDQSPYQLVKHYGVNWQCPVGIVSVVQLFETLSSNHPMAVRKLHNLAGRVIIVDEFHTAVPVRLLRQTMKWLKVLTEVFGCRVILMSGSPIKFWDIKELRSCRIKVKEVLSQRTIEEMDALEKDRVRYTNIEKPFTSLKALADRLVFAQGPTVAVMNTVTSAGVVANYIRENYPQVEVVHLSTSLTPNDREELFRQLKERLKERQDELSQGTYNLILIATSCIETGVNLSFRTGFRESCSCMSLYQLAGRVNRGNEYGQCCDVFSFRLDHDSIEETTANPQFNISSNVLTYMFGGKRRKRRIGYQYCTEALRRELIQSNREDETMQMLEQHEMALNFGAVAYYYNIIPHAYKSVVIDEKVKEKLLDGKEIVSAGERGRSSVQIFYTKADRDEYRRCIETVGIPTEAYIKKRIKTPDELDFWTGKYDRFLGYMAEFLSVDDDTCDD